MCTETKQHARRLYTNSETREYNRYTDILTYEETRVKLAMKPAPNHDTDYINACYVDVSELFGFALNLEVYRVRSAVKRR